MKLRILLSIASIYLACVGLGLIFAPQRFGVGSVPSGASAELVAYLRLFGGPLLGIAGVNWMARNAEPSTARTAIIIGNIIGFAAMAVLDLWGLSTGARPLTKVFAIVHLLFAVTFIWVGRMNISSSKRKNKDVLIKWTSNAQGIVRFRYDRLLKTSLSLNPDRMNN
jgi:hypothetical protein